MTAHDSNCTESKLCNSPSNRRNFVDYTQSKCPFLFFFKSDPLWPLFFLPLPFLISLFLSSFSFDFSLSITNSNYSTLIVYLPCLISHAVSTWTQIGNRWVQLFQPHFPNATFCYSIYRPSMAHIRYSTWLPSVSVSSMFIIRTPCPSSLYLSALIWLTLDDYHDLPPTISPSSNKPVYLPNLPTMHLNAYQPPLSVPCNGSLHCLFSGSPIFLLIYQIVSLHTVSSFFLLTVYVQRVLVHLKTPGSSAPSSSLPLCLCSTPTTAIPNPVCRFICL